MLDDAYLHYRLRHSSPTLSLTTIVDETLSGEKGQILELLSYCTPCPFTLLPSLFQQTEQIYFRRRAAQFQ
jgi:hypothetical protein